MPDPRFQIFKDAEMNFRVEELFEDKWNEDYAREWGKTEDRFREYHQKEMDELKQRYKSISDLLEENTKLRLDKNDNLKTGKSVLGGITGKNTKIDKQIIDNKNNLKTESSQEYEKWKKIYLKEKQELIKRHENQINHYVDYVYMERNEPKIIDYAVDQVAIETAKSRVGWTIINSDEKALKKEVDKIFKEELLPGKKRPKKRNQSRER